MPQTQMSDDEIRTIVVNALHRIAPEADFGAVPGDADLREAIDIDSMDMMNFLVALHERLKIDIPERDYARLTTLDGCVRYLREKA